ncbi:rRNA maturation RNase YbeY [Rhabdobacter roseus]|uniref:Endoribonuclease YbeY n=1 Tax=Rhabdobacter roseus TaxID=1655419 RepID=A0A840TUG6_9BACT|nr:rRNA maturation RNase YbeY [Rhabdobacter roseus]MBB5287591.1 rRNA maturation RNase YbeY [Rhabdobacter roseus]
MISFFAEEISFKVPHPIKTKRWLKSVIEQEEGQLNQLNYIFCSDEYLLVMNRQYLNHDYYTDIITFDTSEAEQEVEGDIFISVDRVQENATELGKTFEEELRRVLVHGLLHLMRYDDTTPKLKAEMRAREDFHLQTYR